MTIAQLIRQERLPADFIGTVEHFCKPLAERVSSWAASGPLLIGINGGQGTGKSTIALFLRALLQADYGLKVAVLSIDDLYLTQAERQQLAREFHPLLAMRGVPGTHDPMMGVRVIEALLQAPDGAKTRLPRFDKAVDDRHPENMWPVFEGRADVVILEGWCVGARPQSEAALDVPINDLERDEDVDGAWRRYVNEQLAGPYQHLYGRIDHLILLRAPSMACIRAWRGEQEQKLRDKLEAAGRDISGLMDEAALDRFVAHYERLTEHQWDDFPTRADAVLRLADDHQFTALEWKEVVA